MTPPPQDDDLLAAARGGDRDAFGRLLERHVPRVRAFLHRLGAGADELDDLTQEVFVAVLRGLAGFREEARFSTWIFGCAVRVLQSARRRAGVRRDVPRPALDEAQPGPHAAAELREEGERLARAIERLPAAHREAFVLRHVEELPAAAAAAILGIPEGTLRRHAHEARERLKELLAPAFVPVARRVP